jgi:transposase
MMPLGRVARRGFPPLPRTRIENLACTDPAAQGLELTHWSARSLQLVVHQLEIAPAIHYTTIATILRTATLQPHRWRYWKTTVWDQAAIRRAAKVLWCYEWADWLRERGILVICVDEKPNIQVLERAGPIRRMRPGQIEQQEFEYVRHGTVNLLVGMTVHDGQMWAEDLEKNDSDHFRPALQRYLDLFRDYRGIYLIMDNGASHIAAPTKTFLQSQKSPWVRLCYTPPHASWLNQAELLLRAFTERYIKRGSWDSWAAMLEHLRASWPEYNQLFAHPFQWSWTRGDFRAWLARKKSRIPVAAEQASVEVFTLPPLRLQIPCNTSATAH